MKDIVMHGGVNFMCHLWSIYVCAVLCGGGQVIATWDAMGYTYNDVGFRRGNRICKQEL